MNKINNINLKNVTIALLLLIVCSCVSTDKKERMLNLLEQAEKMNSGYVLMDTVTFMDEVHEFFLSHGTTEKKIRANYMMGCVFRDRGDSPTTLHYYLEAVSQADTTDAECNFELLSRIYGQMAMLYVYQSYPKKGLEMLEKAQEMAKKAGDERMFTELLAHSSNCYTLLGDRDKAISKIKESQRLYEQLGMKEYAAAMSGELTRFYLEDDSLDKAKREIDRYINDSKLYVNGEIREGCEIFYNYLGLYYEKIGNADSALYFYRKLATCPHHIAYLVSSYKGQLSVYSKNHNVDSVAKYAQLYTMANDTANVRLTAEEVCRVQALYDYTEHQKNALEKTEEANTLWKIISASIIALMIAAVAIYLYIMRQKAKAKAYQDDYMKALTDYRQAVAEYERYKTDKSAYDDLMREKVQQLQDALSTYQEDFDIERLSNEQNLQNHKIVVLLHSYAAKAQTPTAQDWNALLDIAQKMLQKFWNEINSKQYQPTEQEIKLCLLTRLGFMASEIYVLMDLSTQRVSNMRSKLNAKFFNDKSASTFQYNINRIG